MYIILHIVRKYTNTQFAGTWFTNVIERNVNMYTSFLWQDKMMHHMYIFKSWSVIGEALTKANVSNIFVSSVEVIIFNSSSKLSRAKALKLKRNRINFVI